MSYSDPLTPNPHYPQHLGFPMKVSKIPYNRSNKKSLKSILYRPQKVNKRKKINSIISQIGKNNVFVSPLQYRRHIWVFLRQNANIISGCGGGGAFFNYSMFFTCIFNAILNIFLPSILQHGYQVTAPTCIFYMVKNIFFLGEVYTPFRDPFEYQCLDLLSKTPNNTFNFGGQIKTLYLLKGLLFKIWETLYLLKGSVKSLAMGGIWIWSSK